MSRKLQASGRLLLLAAIIFVLFQFFGCTGTSSQQYAQQYVAAVNRTRLDTGQNVTCEKGTCWCMLCQNGTGWVGTRFMNSLVGGRCYFDGNCTAEKFQAYLEGRYGSDIFPRQFMIGQGPSFADFGEANGYCNNREYMAVQWLIGNERDPYPVPDASQAICLLRQDVMPVYVLYSGGTDINDARARSIGRRLGMEGLLPASSGGTGFTPGPVGPVIIVTEMNFNREDADKVARQVRAIDEGCNNNRNTNPPTIHCMIAVAPRMNDSAALDAVMARPGVAERVDLIAFGIDNNMVDGPGKCTAGAVIEAARNFSSFALYKYNKPTIVPYVLFDAAGHDAGNNCRWSEAKAAEGYASFFPGIVTLMQKGVIGVAPYVFNTSSNTLSNPLNCVDCTIGKNEGRLRSWFGGCQAYTRVINTISNPSNPYYPSPGMLIYFSNASGTACDYGSNLEMIFRGMSYGDGAQQRDITNPQPPALQPSTVGSLVRCDACVSNRFSISPFDFGPASQVAPTYIREDPTDLANPANPETTTRISNLPAHLVCYGFPEIDTASSQRGLDPMLVRAFILGESGFKPCDAAKVCSAEYKRDPNSRIPGASGKTCFAPGIDADDECYDMAFDYMEDPDHVCPIERDNAVDPSDTSPPARPRWRWCALGLMQVLEPPYTFWSSRYSPTGVDGVRWNILQRSGMPGSPTRENPLGSDLTGPQSCSPFFNPFNASQNICWGTKKLEVNMRDAQGYLDQYHAGTDPILNWDPNTPDGAEKDRIFRAYIAANLYSGMWAAKWAASDRQLFAGGCTGLELGNCWMQGFGIARRVDAAYCTVAGTEINPDYQRCSAPGVPSRTVPPELSPPNPDGSRRTILTCNGYTDPIQYIHDCELPLMQLGYRNKDRGAGKLNGYFLLRNSCPNSACPPMRQVIGATGGTYPTNGLNAHDRRATTDPPPLGGPIPPPLPATRTPTR